MKKERESVIENYVVRKARKTGWISRKMNGMGFRAWPDRLFIHYVQISVWIEFKRPGEVLTPDQAQIHRILKQRGQDVKTFDNRKAALAYLHSRIPAGLQQLVAEVDTESVPEARRKIHGAARRGSTVPRSRSR